MPALLTWIARAALLAVLGLAAFGATIAHARFPELSLRGDWINHCALSYGITLLVLLSFRNALLGLTGLAVLTLGAGLELAQLQGLSPGQAQWSDLIADLIGATLALAPAAAGRLQPPKADASNAYDGLREYLNSRS